MTIDVSCQKCEASFEIEAADLLEANEHIKCPNCDQTAPQALVEELGNALGDVCKHLSSLRKRFTLSFALESDDLPAPYDTDEEEEEEEEEDDEESLFDDDDDDDDEEDEEEEDDEEP